MTDKSDEIVSSDDFSDDAHDRSDSEVAGTEVIEINEIFIVEDSMSSDDDLSTSDGVTQAEVYDNLKRIGELEDEKSRIQEEIWDRTEQLRSVVKRIDQNSILYKILESALSASAPRGASSGGGKTAASKGAPKAPKKKARKK